jgi:hypothetical protein
VESSVAGGVTSVGPGVPVVEFDHPDRLSRLLIFVKWLLALPHLIVIYLGGIVAAIVVVISWFVVLITGRYPKGLWGFVVGYERYRLRVSSYLLLQTDKYPPFSFEEQADYPVRLSVEHPARMHRWRALISFILAIPAFLVVYIWSIAALLLTIVVWFVILITGRYPKGLFEFNTGALRLTTTTALYSLWTTNKYPL